MHRIISKEKLNPVIHKMIIEAPRAAQRVRPGQFVIIMIDEKGERIPLTICGHDKDKGTITIIFQEAGKTTKKLARLKEGDTLLNTAGPLGRPTMVTKTGKIVLIGGGVGIAELLPIAQFAKELGGDLTIIIGARSGDLLILEDELRRLTERVYVTTDDGSYGEKGVVTQPLKRLLEKEKFSLAYCVGPDIMMKHVCLTTKEANLKTIVSLDANMVDATGMCGTCRVMVGGETKFSCVDGPEFDGHQVDFTEFMARQKRFEREERIALENFEKECRCKKR
ncbi:MAG: sulfide/dihydroorotate dehydrogenase-like FAD/NAD-binding protein [Candidatus Omnitrophica bacterium]|nr:sulfide/dihydroorotate dehydrogenase-like FAD/NAD-binding protein [Candidatus Omnitrophota bacterium]